MVLDYGADVSGFRLWSDFLIRITPSGGAHPFDCLLSMPRLWSCEPVGGDSHNACTSFLLRCLGQNFG
jgi:hypothetical protein